MVSTLRVLVFAISLGVAGGCRGAGGSIGDENSGGSDTSLQPVLLFPIGMHIDPFGQTAQGYGGGSACDDHDPAFFNRHIEDILTVAQLVEVHNGRMTIPAPSRFTRVATERGNAILADLEARNHEIGLHFREDALLGRKPERLPVATWCAAMPQEIGLLPQAGVKNRIRYGSGGNLINPDKIGVWGGSAGGQVVARPGTAGETAGGDVGHYPDSSGGVQAVIDMFGPTGLTAIFDGANPRLLEQVFGTTDRTSAAVPCASPVIWVSRDDPRFLILHGKQDPLVLPRPSPIFYGTRVERVVARTGRVRHHPRVALLEWLDPPFSCGHWSPELVRLAGGVEGLGREGQPSRTLRWEEVADWAPEVVFIACCGFSVERTLEDVQKLLVNPVWQELPAVRAGRVYVSDGMHYFSCPGPRLVDSLEILAHALHPTVHPLPQGLPPAVRLASKRPGRKLAISPEFT
ncbi:MAG: ABC transporter substrate-binding protein [bacterium JZ-2024 1]